MMTSTTLDQMIGGRVLIKPENLQKTGSFKIRGAFNRVAAMTEAEKKRGVVAASAGNHGQALAWAATRVGVKATIVMPRTAAIAKIAATRAYGQEVILEGVDYQEARRAAEALCEEKGALYVDAYDDPLIIAGQGTLGIEIAEQCTPDVVMVPVGGGGLLAGIADRNQAALRECRGNRRRGGRVASAQPESRAKFAILNWPPGRHYRRRPCHRPLRQDSLRSDFHAGATRSYRR